MRSPAKPSLRAGAGRSRIALPASLFPVDGFTGERDPLYARVLLLSAGDQRLVLAVLDQTSIGAASLAGIARVLPAGPALICASHTFSAPHVVPGGPPALQRALEDAVASALHRARDRMRPARLGWATGTASVNVNRDVPTRDGWWLGANAAGPSDRELGVLRVEDLDGHPIAVVLNYAVQASVLNDAGGKLVSADLAGATAAAVERAHPGAVALFLVGAAGDQAPDLSAADLPGSPAADLPGSSAADLPGSPVVDLPGSSVVDVLGAHLGAAAVEICRTIVCDDDAPILRFVRDEVEVGAQPLPRREDIRPQRVYDYHASGTKVVPLWAARVGGLGIAAVQAELTGVTGRWIKDNSPFAATLVVTMANGAAKYLADAGSYERITYAAMNSQYAAGAAEKAAARLVAALNALSS